jgi:hypothetical protein
MGKRDSYVICISDFYFIIRKVDLHFFSLMCIAAVIFIFFAALSGAIAFGGLYGNGSHRNYSNLKFRFKFTSNCEYNLKNPSL